MTGSVTDRVPDAGPASPRVAYQGAPGAFGELAVTRYWRGEGTALPARTFGSALALLGAREVDYAVIPVWNSTIGDLREARDILAEHEASVDVVGSVAVSVEHCVLGLPGSVLDRIRFVGSHPAALAQCAGLFDARPNLKPCPAYDTAGAARELAALARSGAREVDPPPWWAETCRDARAEELAVIASAVAARRYGLITLAESVQDDPQNVTRFAVVAPRGAHRW